MKTQIFDFSTPMPVPAATLFSWHERPGAFERLQPPWETIQVVDRQGRGLEVGFQATIRTRIGPIWQTMVARHTRYEPGVLFQDKMLKGPFAFWEHTHHCEPDAPERSVMHEHIEYALPLGVLGRVFGGGFARHKLQQMFRYRHHVTQHDLADHARYTFDRPQRILVTGSRGVIGEALIPYLTTGGHTVERLLRGPKQPGGIYWDPARGEIDAEALEGFDVVIHLAGENILDGRLDAAKKERVRQSRIASGELLAKTLARLQRPPKVFLSASAVGIYGPQGNTELTEQSSHGDGFLATVCKDWESSTRAAEDAGIRVAHLRIGIVVTPKGGALREMQTVFSLGFGGPLGDGSQYFPWIAIDDVLGSILHCMHDTDVRGPVNLTAPNPVTQRTFAKTLGSVLSRPAILPVPRAALRLAFGDIADESVLASQRVLPAVLQQRGYRYRFETLGPALRHVLGK